MLNIFRIKPEERFIALLSLLFVATLNAMVVVHYYPELSQFSTDYRNLCKDTFHISGFDAWSYSVISEWSGVQFNIHRHPLLAVMCWPLYWLNQGLMYLTGVNCAIFIVAVIEIFFGFYSAIFLYRILREVLELRRLDAHLLTALFFSFAFIILTVMVPDHFNLSMCMMLITLYVAGRRMKSGNPMKIAQTVMIFFVTSGVSLNNGIKIFLAALFANGRRFFRFRYFVMAVILPSAVIWGVAQWEYMSWAKPREVAAKKLMRERDKALRDSIYRAYADTTTVKDPAEIQRGVNKIIRRMAVEKYRRNHEQPRIGDPMSKKGFMAWTDASTDRWRSVVENLFGESLQLHKANLLQDIMKDDRPMIVPYEKPWHYWLEAFMALLFVAGVVSAWRKRFFRLVFSWFAFDMFIYIVLGFGINEVYIMTSQWAFILPVALGCLVGRSGAGLRLFLRCSIAAMALLLYVYNVGLIAGYLFG